MVLVVVRSAYVLQVVVRFDSVRQAVYRPAPAADKKRVVVVVRKRVIHAVQHIRRELHDHRNL